MTLNFDQSLTLKAAQFRPANHWKPRPLTSAARLQYVARMEQGHGVSDHVTHVDASYVARQLSRRDSDGGEGREGRGDRGRTAHSAAPSASAHKVRLCLSACLFACHSPPPPLSLSVCRSMCVCASTPVHIRVCVSICRCMLANTCVGAHICVCMSVCLSVCLSVPIATCVYVPISAATLGAD